MEEHLGKAKDCFQGTGLEIRTDGIIFLGLPIGSKAFVDDQIRKKVDLWTKDLSLLSNIAETQPQAAYSSKSLGVLLQDLSNST